jgi:hypothetical protein
MMRRLYQRLCGVIVIGVVCGANSSVASAVERPAIDFNRDIRSILSNNCFTCHGPDENERQSGLRLDLRESATAECESGAIAIVPGDLDKSELVQRLTSDDEFLRMPPADSGKQLSPSEIARLIEWVRQGAPYAEHWSYVRPLRPELPAPATRLDGARLPPGTDAAALAHWPKNQIDHFILDRMLREGLTPSDAAERYAIARRLSLDLTGLPPTVEEVDQFVNDSDPSAYENLVDRLLAKEAYGEHWARMWLDLARYADSAGYADDPPRTIWAFRDYVIRSLNANKPFDQFTIEQIAGDLLPNPTQEQLVATAFHRNTLTNNEGGTNDEEFRNVAIVDRVNTTMAVWMGTTINCAQCHNHKYDPISQEEFFRMFAIFNNTEDADRRNESPLVEIWTDEQQQQKKKWETEIAELGRALATATPPQPSEPGEPVSNNTSELQAKRDRLAALKKQLAEAKPTTTVPVMRELPEGRRRTTRIQRRGNFLELGDEVTAGLPAVFQDPPEAARLDRLALAKWLVDENNPLTARVIVNRYWEAIFGVGLVRTSEEFGSQGELPSHPELLDWLATELVASGWDLKHLLRLLVTTATYRQSSRVTSDLIERDPDNRLLARGPRFRLSAEMVRDQALFVSGLLSPKMYGPPVKPPQPALGLSAAFGSRIDWQTSQGEDRYRRGLYTTWRRSNPYPSMAAFDAPNREVCTIRRDRTNTPLQALVTLNDPVHVEAAQALARQMAQTEGGADDKARRGFRRCLARHPSDAELSRLVSLYEEARERFSQNADVATKMATKPLGPVPEGLNVTDLAAWTVVANVLLNLDEMLMKR